LFLQIAPAEAGRFVGQTVTVCGEVRSTRYAFTLKGRPTLINLDSVEDNFSIVIWGKHRKNFQRPDFDYADTHLCVVGKIQKKEGAFRVEVKNPNQIVVVKAAAR
jgi:hypothetical protein